MKRLVVILVLIFVSAVATGAYMWLARPLGISVEEARRTLPQRLSRQDLKMRLPVFIRIFKEESELEVWMEKAGRWTLFHSYPVCRWSGKLGPKLREGDRQAPEGFYAVGLGQLNPKSRWHLSFNLGFPNAFDRSHGRTGSFLMVHGGCTSIGCYAMTNGAVDDIYRIVEAALRTGQQEVQVHIFPFRMTGTNMARHAGSRWFGFWQDLKRGHDVFEQNRKVPAVRVMAQRYLVES
jgi:murein L,D-transpeptidase YafK